VRTRCHRATRTRAAPYRRCSRGCLERRSASQHHVP
jgi:hypothetical protein